MQMAKDPMTDQQIADALGVTRQRAAQIIEEALRKLRYEMKKRGLRADDIFDVVPVDWTADGRAGSRSTPDDH
jgi:hypothetical protein